MGGILAPREHHRGRRCAVPVLGEAWLVVPIEPFHLGLGLAGTLTSSLNKDKSADRWWWSAVPGLALSLTFN